MKPARLFGFFILLTILAAGSATAAEGMTSDHPPVAVQTLQNGLQVVAIPDRRAPVVTHMIWYRAGSADEPMGKSGIAHFLEHLMFKGTKNTPAGEFSRKVAEIGGDENAFTSYDYTAYFQKVAPDALAMVMGYEADRMQNLVISDDVMETERNVVLEERRSRIDSQPGAILDEARDATLFVHHPYGTPVIGWLDEIRSLTTQDAINFYERHYAPGNAILVVAGDVSPETVFELAAQTYGKVEPRGDTAERNRVREPRPVAARRIDYSHEQVTTPSLDRLYLVPSYFSAQPGEAEALDLLAAILGGSSTSRLYRELVTGSEIAVAAGAWYQGAMLDQSRFGFYVRPRGDNSLADLEKALDAIIQRLVEEGVTQEELDRQRDALVRSVVFERDSQTTLARLYGATLAMGGGLQDIHDWPQRLGKVTVDDINAVARKYLSRERSVTSYLRPKS